MTSTTPLGGELAYLVDEIVERPADLATAHRRNDAERARVVAADLDGHPGRVVEFASRRQRTGERLGVVADGFVEDLDDRAVLGGQAQQLTGAMHVVRTEDDIDVPGPPAHQVAVLLGQAPADRDLEVGAAVLFDLEMAQQPVELVVGVLADAARVEHDDIGVFDLGRRFVAVGLEQPGDPLGVVLVHLAPEGAHDVLAGHYTKARPPGAGDMRR